jgi:hypothetical protein
MDAACCHLRRLVRREDVELPGTDGGRTRVRGRPTDNGSGISTVLKAEQGIAPPAARPSSSRMRDKIASAPGSTTAALCFANDNHLAAAAHCRCGRGLP